MKPSVYVTRRLPEAMVEALDGVCDVRMWGESDIPVPREVLEREAEQADGLLCLLTDRIDDALLGLSRRLKIVSNMAVGYNNIDVEAATTRGIMVANTPGVLTESTAELTFALLMACARRLLEASELLRQGNWKTWSPMLLAGQDLHGATLGIIGLGRIGESVAKKAKAFDMNVLYCNRSRKPDAERAIGLQYAELDDLLERSDFVCVLTPYTAETHHLIRAEHFARMKPTAIFLNTARGGVVNEADLFAALTEGRILAAGLDVFETEPVPTNHPLLTLPNVVALPHIGSATVRTRLRMGRLAAEQVLDGVSGRIPPNLVNPSFVGSSSRSVER